MGLSIGPITSFAQVTVYVSADYIMHDHVVYSASTINIICFYITSSILNFFYKITKFTNDIQVEIMTKIIIFNVHHFCLYTTTIYNTQDLDYTFELFDTWASQSFISTTLHSKLKLIKEKLSDAVEVSVHTFTENLNCGWNMQKHRFGPCRLLIADWHVLDIRDFDIILRMDLLEVSRITINCLEKELIFQKPEEP